MIKNILILIACGLIVWLSLIAFKFLGNYSFLIMIVITFLGLMSGVKPKFGNKDRVNKDKTKK
jgi:hypothetical protein